MKGFLRAFGQNPIWSMIMAAMIFIATLLGYMEYRMATAPTPEPIVKTLSIPAEAVEVNAKDLNSKVWSTVTKEDWDLIYRSHDFIGSPQVVFAYDVDGKPFDQEFELSLFLERKSGVLSVRRENVPPLFHHPWWHMRVERINYNTYRFYPVRNTGSLVLGAVLCLVFVIIVCLGWVTEWSKLKAAYRGVKPEPNPGGYGA